MSNLETERFREYLCVDQRDGSVVKLDLKVEPWEVVGVITEVGEDRFTITQTSRRLTFLMTDIRHYRLA